MVLTSGLAAAQETAAKSAEAGNVTVSANAGWTSQYFYRGIPQKTSSASAGLNVGLGPISLGTWAADVGDGSEIDLFGSVGGTINGFSLQVGGTAYLYTGQFDDTYKEANILAGYGPVSAEFSAGHYNNFGAGNLNYWFFAATATHKGFYGKYGMFGNGLPGGYGEAGYGFSAADLDFSIVGILNDSDLSGLVDGSGKATPGLTLVFGIAKLFSLK
jgi:uncharacterized protein (TIGR02001 family)